MTDAAASRRTYRLFADLLDYPGPDLAETAQECEALVSPAHPEAAGLLREFTTWLRATPLGRVEEIYTGAFDLGASFCPYVGHHLFGERYERSAFMLELKERYRARGVDTGGELPDHLAPLLRYLAARDDAEPAEELIGEALLPALAKILGGSGAGGHGAAGEEPREAEGAQQGERLANPYRRVLHALELVLRHQLQEVGRAPDGGRGRCGHE
ncbi:MAG: molecular chaperone TorD family protein [Gemmatimonadetes bacterium]|nr:molecular chaperone TorD family protein [Gemmatimonadota bacterium]